MEEKRTVKFGIAYPRSLYAKKNIEHISDVRPLGPARATIDELVRATDINKSILSGIIGISPSSPNWDSAIKVYYESFYFLPPMNGKDLNLNFVYTDNNDKDYKRAKAFIAKRKDLFDERFPDSRHNS